MTTQEFIEAIKSLTVLELNDLVKACEEEFEYYPSSRCCSPAAGPAEAAEERN